jgi:hypothetical protein
MKRSIVSNDLHSLPFINPAKSTMVTAPSTSLSSLPQQHHFLLNLAVISLAFRNSSVSYVLTVNIVKQEVETLIQ